MSAASGSTKQSHIIDLKKNVYSSGFTYSNMKLSTLNEPLKKPTRTSKHILILGGGVSGLMTAWMLLDKGFRVTILADDWAWSKDFDKSRMTSQIAGALWEFPPGGCGLTEIESVGSGWANIEHYREWATQSFDFYSRFNKLSNSFEKHGHSFGLQMTTLYQFFYDDVISGTRDDDESKKFKALQELEKAHKSFKLKIEMHDRTQIIDKFDKIININLDTQGLQTAYSHLAPIINTDKAMGYLMALVSVKGASLETKNLGRTIKEFGAKLLKDYGADVIVNATGLGAGALADDKDVYPVRGAVVRVDNSRASHFRHLNDAYLVPAQRNSVGHPTKTIFIVPRNDDVLYVGSIIQPNNDQILTEDSPEVRQMWDRAANFMPALLEANTVPLYPFAQGLRPFTKKNAKVRADPEAPFPLVHNYGHGGSGWTLGIGTARCAVHIVEKLLSAVARHKKDEAARTNNATMNDPIDWEINTAAATFIKPEAKQINDAIYGVLAVPAETQSTPSGIATPPTTPTP